LTATANKKTEKENYKNDVDHNNKNSNAKRMFKENAFGLSVSVTVSTFG